MRTSSTRRGFLPRDDKPRDLHLRTLRRPLPRAAALVSDLTGRAQADRCEGESRVHEEMGCQPGEDRRRCFDLVPALLPKAQKARLIAAALR
jgi:hypothetical protein